MTHDIARADPPLAQTHVRAPAPLPGEALSASIDTNAPIVGIARARAERLRHGREPSLSDLTAFIAPRVAPEGVRGVVTNHVVLARASASDSCWTSRGRDARCGLPAPHRLGRRGSPASWSRSTSAARRGARIRRCGERTRARLGRARARPARHGRERRRASSSWRRRPGCLTATSSRPASTTSWPSCSCSRSATPPGSRSTRGASPSGAPRRSGSSRCWRRSLDERIAGAASGPFAESLEELLVESPRDHADGVCVPRARDVRPSRPRAARPAPAGYVAGGPDDAAAIVGSSSTPWGAADPRARRRHLELRAGRRPAHRPPGRDRRRRGALRGRHGPARRCRRTIAPAARAPRRARLVVLITHPDSDHLGGTAEVLAAHPARACWPARWICRWSAIPSG